jgi:hypothetical protein
MKEAGWIILVCAALSLPAFAQEKKITLGAAEGWRRVSHMDGVNPQTGLRPYPVLMPDSTRTAVSSESAALDLALHFDEMDPRRYRDAARHYALNVSDGVYPAPVRWAYWGNGAAVFDKDGKAFITVKSASPNALFSDNNRVGSFSLEFFLFPRSVESGAEIFSWSALPVTGKSQLIRAAVVRNRVSVIFDGFFVSTGNGSAATSINLRLSSEKTLAPEKYSHHLIRYDHSTGLIEYLVDGTVEDVRYTTENGRENGPSGEIYEPFTGGMGELMIGRGFNGIIDEFKVYSGFLETAETARFSAKPGWIESETIDLGSPLASLCRLTATGGYTIPTPRGSNRYAGNLGEKSTGSETLPNSSAIQFFIRVLENPFDENDPAAWTEVQPGETLNIRGQYARLAAAFYPSADQSGVPYLSSLSLVYQTVEPLSPPPLVNAVAGDGFVDLSWKPNRQPDVGGYMVYIGTKSGEYWERQPIDAGNVSSLHIDGLENGVVYYFAIMTYCEKDVQDGVFSKEIQARPLSAVRQPLERVNMRYL